MEKPTKLAFSEYGTFRFFRAEILMFIGMIVSVLIIVRVTRDDPLAPVTLSEIMMSALCLVWVGVFWVGAWGYRIWEKIQIKRMFAGEIWECWQFSTREWESEVEAVCNLISPKDEGKDAYRGVIASSIFGFVIAVILFVITFFAFAEPEIKIAMRIVALGLFLFMIGVGIIHPKAAKKKADRYRSKAQ